MNKIKIGIGGDSIITSFEPIIDERSKLIILGSMPGVESLRQSQYYAHKRNQFWRIIYEIFDNEKSQSYSERIEFLKSHHIALWDVVKSCKRVGSLDSNIKDEEVNELISLFSRYNGIRYVIFNGTTAKKLFKKHIGFKIHSVKEFFLLPSTSPANTIPYLRKLEEWKIIRELL